MVAYNLTTDKTWYQTECDVENTFRKWGVSKWDVITLLNGRARAKQNQTPQERAVTLRYTRKGREVSLVMNKQARAVDNFRVLYLTLEAMRLNELRGIDEVMQDAYLQLAAPADDDPYRVLEVAPGASTEVIEAAYRAKAKQAHPDVAGGSTAAMQQLNAARDALLKEAQP